MSPAQPLTAEELAAGPSVECQQCFQRTWRQVLVIERGTVLVAADGPLLVDVPFCSEACFLAYVELRHALLPADRAGDLFQGPK